VVEYGHAVNRDLMDLGYRTDESLISLGDFVSAVLASPQGSAVRFAAEKGWSQTDLLLAQHNEQTFGVRYERPGVEDAPDARSVPVVGGVPQMTPQTIEEFTKRRQRDIARGSDLAATEKKLA
jgi:hypothetical protein